RATGGTVEGGRRQERARREPHELELPADRAERAVAVGRERRRDDRPREDGPAEQQNARRQRKPGEEPADPREAEQPERQLVARERGRAAAADAVRDPAAVDPRERRDRPPCRLALARRQRPG